MVEVVHGMDPQSKIGNTKRTSQIHQNVNCSVLEVNDSGIASLTDVGVIGSEMLQRCCSTCNHHVQTIRRSVGAMRAMCSLACSTSLVKMGWTLVHPTFRLLLPLQCQSWAVAVVPLYQVTYSQSCSGDDSAIVAIGHLDCCIEEQLHCWCGNARSFIMAWWCHSAATAASKTQLGLNKPYFVWRVLSAGEIYKGTCEVLKIRIARDVACTYCYSLPAKVALRSFTPHNMRLQRSTQKSGKFTLHFCRAVCAASRCWRCCCANELSHPNAGMLRQHADVRVPPKISVALSLVIRRAHACTQPLSCDWHALQDMQLARSWKSCLSEKFLTRLNCWDTLWEIFVLPTKALSWMRLSEEMPLKTCANAQARDQNINRANLHENKMVY